MDIVSQRRGKNAAILGLIFQIILVGTTLTVWLASDSRSAMTAFWLSLGGLAPWLMSAVLFYCRQLQQQEAMEVETLSARAPGGSIFETQEAELRPAAGRLKWMHKWIVPIFTLLLAGYLMVLGIFMLQVVIGSPRGLGYADADARTASWIVSVIVAFLGFMLSRYCSGMGSQETYRPLRATGGYLLLNVLAMVAVIASLVAMNWWGNKGVDYVVAHVLPALMILLAAEMAVNLLLDLYRPRVHGQEQRLAYDSRLIGLLAYPGRIGHSIAETLNYQFGFEVSKTWFYQMLSRAMIPMLAVGAAILLAMTSVAIIPQGQKGLVFHCGKIARQVDSGVYFVWPWPIDRVQRFDVREIHNVYLGEGEHRDPIVVNGREMVLWSQDHGRHEEKDFLVAVPPSQEAKKNKSVPVGVNVIKLVVLVQYRIADVVKYGLKYDDPGKQLELLANREMTRCLASATLTETVDSTDRPQAIMTFGRKAAGETLKRRIRQAVEDDLGVEIVDVSIQAIHPSQESLTTGGSTEKKGESVAWAYEKAMAAQQSMEQKRHDAQGRADIILSDAAGSPGLALKLALAIRKHRELDGLLTHLAEKDFRAQVDNVLMWTRKELENIQAEIRADQLVGRVSESLVSATQPAAPGSLEGLGSAVRDRLEMRTLYEQYVAELLQIRQGRRGDIEAALTRAGNEVENLFKSASGQAAILEATAQAKRWEAELAERSSAENFARELAAYRNAPNVYLLDRYLDVYDQTLPGVTKYVLGVPRGRIDLRVDMRTDAQVLEGAPEKVTSGGTENK